MTNLDLKTLARRRGNVDEPIAVPRRHVLTRYVIPGMLTMGFAALGVWSTRDRFASTRPVAVIPVHVSQTESQREGTPLFKAAGWVEPKPTPIRVAALASGVVQELHVVQDQHIKTGEPIAQLVAADAELGLKQALANLALRSAELREAEAQAAAAKINLQIPAHLELPVAEAEAALAVIETELTNLPRQLERAQARLRLAEIDRQAREKARQAVSAVDIAQAQSECDAAAAKVDELTQRLPKLEQQRTALLQRRDAAAKRLALKTDEKQAFDTALARVAAAEARQIEADVAVKEAQLRLERMTIRAPVTGRILELLTSPGSQLMVGPSQLEKRDSNTVVTMYQPESLQVRVDVRFEDLPRVRIDQPILVDSPAIAQPLEGRVLFLTGFANVQKNTLEVKVSLEQPPEVIKPEMLVDVTFLAPPQEAPQEGTHHAHRLFLPTSVVHNDESGSFVWLANLQRHRAEKHPITTTASRTPNMVEITTGLNEASRVIASDTENLRHGDRITIRKDSSHVTD